MAIRNIYIAPKKGEEKPLEICELEGQGNMPASIGNFFLGESEMKKVAEKIAKSLTKNKGTQRWQKSSPTAI